MCIKKISPTVVVSIEILQPLGHNYYLIDTQVLTWEAAMNYCRKYYDDIATVANADDWIRLRKEETDKGLTSRAWIGLYNDIESWRWSFNNVSLKNQMLTMWYAGEPNNLYGKEACASIDQMGEW